MILNRIAGGQVRKISSSAFLAVKQVFGFLALLAADAAIGQIVSIDLATPTLDRWNYPFAGDPGGNTYAAVFAPLTSGGGGGFDPQFDNRDGQMLIGYSTAALVSPGLGAGRYRVNSGAVTITIETGNVFQYDPTPDSYRSWLPPEDPDFVADADPGHAVELFGTRFRNQCSVSCPTPPCFAPCSALNYSESAPYSPLGAFGKGIRSAFPIAFNAAGQCVDVSNNVDARFDPEPFAVGMNANLTPGQLVPVNTPLRFELDVDDPNIQRWLRRSLNDGMIDFAVASIFPSQQQKSGGPYPRLYTKEHLAVLAHLVDAARLEMQVEILPTASPLGDVTGNGAVNIDDLLAVINSWGSCPCCAADVDGNGLVNIDDLLAVINTWSG
jgi:hypothetical protein